MSFDSGPGGYAPPAPKKALSPWAWVGIGCGTLTVLGLGGCIAMGVMFKNAIDKAPTPEVVMAELEKAEVPIYPGATFDVDQTKMASGTAGGMIGLFSGGKIKMHMGAFSVADPASKVQEFYQDKLGPIGYSTMNQEFKNPAGRNMEQRQYKKDGVMVMVQTQNPARGKTGCVLILSKVTGLPKEKLK
jgi:hypothetical protein